MITLISPIISIILYGILGVAAIALIIFAIYKMSHATTKVESYEDKEKKLSKQPINYDDIDSILAHGVTGQAGIVHDCKECGHCHFLKDNNNYKCCFCGHEYSKDEFDSLGRSLEGENVGHKYYKNFITKHLMTVSQDYKDNFKKVYGFTLEQYYAQLLNQTLFTCFGFSDDEKYNKCKVTLYKSFILFQNLREENSGVAKDSVLNPMEYLRTNGILASAIIGARHREGDGFYSSGTELIIKSGYKLTHIITDSSRDDIEKLYPGIFSKGENNANVQKDIEKLKAFEDKYGFSWEKFQDYHDEIAAISTNINDDHALNSSGFVHVKFRKAFYFSKDENLITKLQNQHYPDMEQLSKCLFTDKDIYRVEASNYDDHLYNPGHKAGLLDYALGDAAAGGAGMVMAAMTNEDPHYVSRFIESVTVYVPQEVMSTGSFKVRQKFSYDSGIADLDTGYEYFKNLIGKIQDRQVKKNDAVTNIAILKGFKELLDSGAITQEEFDAKKKELL